MNENLNLVEILKDCPKGTKLYSTIYGEVELIGISIYNPIYGIEFRAEGEVLCTVTSDGKHYDDFNGECTLFPSREQRDWSKFKTKKAKFDPKSLQTFDRVLVRDNNYQSEWKCDLFSHIDYGPRMLPYKCTCCSYRYCIPYNEETKHLIGSNKQAPEYYRYWED